MSFYREDRGGGVYDGPPDHVELLNSDALLRACFSSGLTRDETIAVLSRSRLELLQRMTELVARGPAPVVLVKPSEDGP